MLLKLERWAPWCLLAAVFFAYHNSFEGPFIFDGSAYILNNHKIQSLWPLTELLEGSTRPLTRLSFAVNYAFGGFDVFGYHAINFCIHFLAAWTLYALVRATLVFSPALQRYKGSLGTSGVALSAALLWALHPLQTESVTYIFQRAESLMGLFYLLTLYAFTRARLAIPGRRKIWYFASWVACLAGMSSKAVMITAPFFVLFYDRVYWSDSWKEIWSERRKYYFALAATWSLLVVILAGQNDSSSSVGWSLKFVGPLQYTVTQSAVILHYLKLAVWPSDLVLDYVWKPMQYLDEAIVPLVAILALIWAVGRLCRKRLEAGFLGVMFFILLLPTSSFFPIADVAAEHRMYLPLAPLAVAAALVGRRAIYLLSSSEASERFMRVFVLCGLALALGLRTAERNFDYRFQRVMWSKVTQQRPLNPRAHANLGVALERRRLSQEAIVAFEKAFSLMAAYPNQSIDIDTLCANYAASLLRVGRYDEAIYYCRYALNVNPDSKEALGNLTAALALKGEFQEATLQLERLQKINPGSQRVQKLAIFVKSLSEQAGAVI